MTAARRDLLQRGRAPIVGYVSFRNTLEVAERHDRVVVTVSARTRFTLMAAGLLFGPGLAVLFALTPGRFTRMPWFIQGVVVLTVAGMTAVLLRSIFIRPSLELLANGDVSIPHRRVVIPRAAIREVSIETDMYRNPRRIHVENAVLVIRTEDGDLRLAVSPDRSLIERLAKKITDTRV